MGACCSGHDQALGGDVVESRTFLLHPGSPSEVYLLGKAIGVGACATVLEGTSLPSAGRPTRRALKVLEHAVQRVQAVNKEVAVLSELAHPNIVRLYEVFRNDAESYLVMEACDGGHLLQSVLDAGRFSEAKAASSMLQVIRAVRYSHERRVAHRDLKCENLLWQGRASDVLKLVDFGTSRRFVPGESMCSAVGTPLFISPEIIRGKYTEACDLWACGCMLYILLAGYAPFHGKTNLETYKLIATGPLRFRDEEWGAVSSVGKDLVRGLLNRKVALRLRAAQALEHPWLQEAVASERDPDIRRRAGELLARRLADFAKQSIFKKLMLLVVAHLYREEDVGDLRRMFLCLDEGTGVLSRRVLEAALPAGADPARLLDEVGVPARGWLDYRAFLTVTADPGHYSDEAVLREAFDFLDRGRRGYIDVSTLSGVLAAARPGALQVICAGGRESVLEELGRGDFEAISFEEVLEEVRGRSLPRRWGEDVEVAVFGDGTWGRPGVYEESAGAEEPLEPLPEGI